MKLFKSLIKGRQTLLTSDVHACAVARGSSCRGCAADGDIPQLVVVVAASRFLPMGAFLCCVCHKELRSKAAGRSRFGLTHVFRPC